MIRRAMRFWSEETGLTALLIFLSLEMFLLFPLLHRGILLGLVNATLYSFLLLAGLLSITRHPLLRSASAIFVCCDHSRELVAPCRYTGLRVLGRPAFCSWSWRTDGRGVVGGPQGRSCNSTPDTWRDRRLPAPCGFLRICLRPHRIRVPGFLTFSGGYAGGKAASCIRGFSILAWLPSPRSGTGTSRPSIRGHDLP